MKHLKTLISYSFNAFLWWAFIYVAYNLDTILYDLLIK